MLKPKAKALLSLKKNIKKYGRNAVKEELTVDPEENSDTKTDGYKSILDDENSETEKVESTEEEKQ